MCSCSTLVHGWATGKYGLTRPSRPRLEGRHHLPPYSVLCAWPRFSTQMAFCLGTLNGNFEIPKLGPLWLWGCIPLGANLQLRWSLKQSCSLCWELFNGMLHTTCTQGNRGDFWLLVVGSQITFPSPSFGHNLCLKCPNGSCEPTLDI